MRQRCALAYRLNNSAMLSDEGLSGKYVVYSGIHTPFYANFQRIQFFI